jgi:integrase
MKTKLTKRAVDATQVGAKDSFIWDSEVPGFGLKVTPAGKKLYVLQYRLGGRGTPTRRYTIGQHGADHTPDEARDKAITLRGKIKEGADPQAEKEQRAKAALGPKRQTFPESADAYLRQAAKKLRPSSYKEWSRIIERDVLPSWRSYHTEDISRSDVRALLQCIADRGAETQANRTLARLRTLFNWAVEQDIITVSPCTGLKPVKKETARDRAFSDNEIRWFWNGCDQLSWPFGPLFKLLLLTAQRRDEVGTMEWSEIDLQKHLWVIPREKAKNDRAHEVALSDLAIEIITAIKEERSKLDHLKASPFVFTTNGNTPVSGFSRAKERLHNKIEKQARQAAGLPAEEEAYRQALALRRETQFPMQVPEWILHDLRRTAATGMARLNVPPHVVDRVLNHVSGTIRGVAAIYNRHGYTEERKNALEAWARYVQTLIRPVDSNVISIRA